jgi:hypothetical protein
MPFGQAFASNAGKSSQCIGGVTHRSIELGQLIGICHRVVLPTAIGYHQVAGREIAVVGLQYAANGLSAHCIAERHGFNVGRPRSHSAAHVRIEREIQSAQQHLT